MLYHVEASIGDPRTGAPVADFEKTVDRGEVDRLVREYHSQGLWVEVFADGGTGELLAGPFDPDAKLPASISF